MQQVIFQDLQTISYKTAWDYQQDKLKELIERKLQYRRSKDQKQTFEQHHYLIFCEHPPVYTLGKSGSADHLLLDQKELEENGFEYFKINRGGDITYHGPGQLVGYPIFDLDCFFTDVHKYVRYLEEVVIQCLGDFGILATRMKNYTGVWIEGDEVRPHRKICAIGVHLSRWVTMHGFALNVNPELAHFNNIVPCGIAEENKVVTSMKQELGHSVDFDKVKDVLKLKFAKVFGYEYGTPIYEKGHSST